jgi:type IV pilus assembly protein PilW
MTMRHPRHRRPAAARGQGGFTLVELMISIVVGMVIIAALALLFANNSRARQEMDKTSQQIENGRYATQYLRDDLRLAGYWGEFSPESLTPPAAVPDPSLTDDASVSAAVPLHVQGYHSGMDATFDSTLPAGVTALLTDRKANTDVLVVRRASTCVAGPSSAEPGCSAQDLATSKYFQTSLCTTQLDALAAAGHYDYQFLIGTDANAFTTANANITTAPTYLTQRDCATAAVTRAVHVHIYYVANNDVAGDGIPTLKMVSLKANSFAAPVAIAEGIEAMQLEWGLDDGTGGAAINDGIPDNWKTDPAYGIAAAADQVTAWQRVTAVKVHLIARNTQASTGQFEDTRKYVLGSTTAKDNTFGPYNDGYKRHVYSTVVRIANAAGRLGN